MICDRCHEETVSGIGSMFNTELICASCKRKEELHELYQAACEAELAACKVGNFNFPGIGLPPELRKGA